jgi:HK97 family phage major capsid protein/HK97 family phage prohead protease
MLTRAYSVLTIKSVDAEQRVIEGMATTPTPDRVGDVVEPKGVKHASSIPLLLHHDSRLPVGTVKLHKATDDGIAFTARIPKIDEPGTLQARVDEAWQSIKSGLIKGVSIGFRVMDDGIELLRSGGVRFTSTEVLELSLVAVPANAEATIQSIKSIDAQYRPASGEGQASVPPTTAGVSVAVVSQSRGTGRAMKQTITQQIKDFEATRAAKVAERDAIMDDAAEKGLTLDAAQTEQYDGLDTEIKSIDQHLTRLRAREVENKAAAVTVAGSNGHEANASRGLTQVHVGKVNRDPGIGFARMAMAKMASYISMKEGGFLSALDIAKRHWPSDTELHAHIIQKTNIPAGTTTDTNWATELVEPTTLGSEFLEFLRAQTILGKFGTNGVPALRSLPFNIRMAQMTSGLTGYWVGEGAGKPTSKGAIGAVTLPYTKVAAISVITQELARFSNPSAERVVRDELARSVSARIDTDFVDPAIAAVSGVKPASITNGLTAMTSAGTSADNARTDVMNLVEQFILNHMDVSSLVILMPNTLALALSVMRNSLGQQEFPGLTLNGGRLEGIPVITSQYLASGASYGNMVVALSANDIGLADDGAVDVKVSGEATLEMTDTPVGESTTPTAMTTAFVSMFQSNSLAILAERFITWKKLRSTAVVFMDDVNWGSIGSPV